MSSTTVNAPGSPGSIEAMPGMSSGFLTSATGNSTGDGDKEFVNVYLKNYRGDVAYSDAIRDEVVQGGDAVDNYDHQTGNWDKANISDAYCNEDNTLFAVAEWMNMETLEIDFATGRRVYTGDCS